jgi:hypothetical protein
MVVSLFGVQRDAREESESLREILEAENARQRLAAIVHHPTVGNVHFRLSYSNPNRLGISAVLAYRTRASSHPRRCSFNFTKMALFCVNLVKLRAAEPWPHALEMAARQAQGRRRT